MRAVPSSVTALISEAVVSGSTPAPAIGGNGGGARKHVTVSNFARVVDRATQLPLTRAEAVCLAKLMLKLQKPISVSSPKSPTASGSSTHGMTSSSGVGGVDDCYVDVALLETIRVGEFLK